MAWRAVAIDKVSTSVSMCMWSRCGYVQLMHEYNSTHFRSSVVGQTKKSEVLMNTEWSELSIGMCRYIIGWRGRVERVGEVSNHPSSWRMRCSNSPSPSCISEEAPARANVDHGDAHAHIHARGRARPVGGRCCFDGMMMMRSREEIELPAAVRERRCRRRSRRQPDDRQTSGTSWHLASGTWHPATSKKLRSKTMTMMSTMTERQTEVQSEIR